MDNRKKSIDLIIADRLNFQNQENVKQSAELVIVNKELVFQNEEKEKLAKELIIAGIAQKKTEVYLKEYIRGLEKMMFIISHKVRQPIANILGLSNLLNYSVNSPNVLQKLVGHIKKSALSLDSFTKELTLFTNDLIRKGKKNGDTNICPKKGS